MESENIFTKIYTEFVKQSQTQEPEQEAKNARHSHFVSWSLKSCRDCAKTSHISTCTNKNGQNSIPEAGYKRAGQTRRRKAERHYLRGAKEITGPGKVDHSGREFANFL